MAWLWLLGYGMLFSVAERLSFALRCPFSLTLPALLCYHTLLIYYLRKSRLSRAFGLCWPQHTGIFLYLPLLAVPMAARLLFPSYFSLLSPIAMLYEGLQIFCYVFGEEIFFRGFLLLRAINKHKLRVQSGLLLSTLAFSLFHFANLFAGATLPDVCVQALYAAAVGLCLAVFTLHTRSILPSILLHSASNLLASGSKAQFALSDTARLYYAFAAVGLFTYGLWLYLWPRKKR